MLLTILLPFAILPFTLAKPGDPCQSSQGSGTCKATSSCKTGFTWPNACPNDAADIKCCIEAACPSGTCLDKDITPCSDGTFKAGLCPGGASVQCCQRTPGTPEGPPQHPTPKPTDNFIAYLRQLYNLATQYGGSKNPNQLVMEWLRHTEYNDAQWKLLIGDIDDGFTAHVQAAGVQMMDTFPDPEYPGLNVKISHLGACMNGVFLKGKAPPGETNRADVTGWGGDWMTFYGEWRRDSDAQPSGGAYTRAHMANLVDENTFKMRDMVEDADCYNIGMKIRDNPALNIADEMAENLANGYRTRMQRFVNGRFAGNAAAIAKSMLLPGGDVVINSGRIYLIEKNGGGFVKLPLWLSEGDMGDLVGGFRDRLDGIVREEAGKYPPR